MRTVALIGIGMAVAAILPLALWLFERWAKGGGK